MKTELMQQIEDLELKASRYDALISACSGLVAFVQAWDSGNPGALPANRDAQIIPVRQFLTFAGVSVPVIDVEQRASKRQQVAEHNGDRFQIDPVSFEALRLTAVEMITDLAKASADPDGDGLVILRDKVYRYVRQLTTLAEVTGCKNDHIGPYVIPGLVDLVRGRSRKSFAGSAAYVMGRLAMYAPDDEQ